MYLPKNYRVLLFLVLLRLTSVFVVQTAHVPDEYWQSLEVAHQLAFGYGYLTWEWTTNIRNYIYPFLISILYRILACVSLDYAALLTTLPRALQAIISAYGEYRFYKWTGNKWTLYSLCINWYWYYCATRTIINTFETSLTMIALSMFPWRDSNIRSMKFMWIVGFLCMIRPTAAIIWLPLCIYHFSTSLQNKSLLILKYAALCGTCFVSSTLLDSYYYGALVVSPWEFFRVNILHKVGDFYGTQPLLWYISSGLAVLLGLYYVVFILSIWQIMKHPASFHRQAVMLIVIGWTLGIYSFLSHKEFRFLLPLLPMLIYICTSCMSHLSIKFSMVTRKIFVGLLIFSNLLPGLYFCLIHQRGSLDVMSFLRKEVINSNVTASVSFLTPCHATPLYSHLHVNVSTKILTCEPNLKGIIDYVDEADTFFAEPMQWLDDNYNINEKTGTPSYVVVFENVVPKIKKFLENFQLIAAIFHTHFPQSNYGKYIYVYKKKRRL